MSPKFNAISGGRLRPHIVHAFLQKLHFSTEELHKVKTLTTKNGKEYNVVHDYTALADSASAEFICSFQEWMDGRRYAIIRPFNPSKVKAQQAAAEGTEQS